MAAPARAATGRMLEIMVKMGRLSEVYSVAGKDDTPRESREGGRAITALK